MPGEDFITYMQTVSFWVQERNFADEVRLLTEKDIDPVELHNARILAAFREPDPDADAAAWEFPTRAERQSSGVSSRSSAR